MHSRTHTTTDRGQSKRVGWPAWLPLLTLMLVVLGVFLPTLPFEFTIYDEQKQLVQNPLVHSLRPDNLIRMFTCFSITNYYPIRLLSFAVDYAVWGLRPAGYRLTNIVLHLTNISLVLLLILRVTRAAGLAQPGGSSGRTVALLAAALFALHPVVVEPVVWISGREELLMVFFTLACVHFHIAAGRAGAGSGRIGPSGPGRAFLFHALAGICAACACMSNVVAVVIPALIVAYDLVVQGSVRRAIGGTWFLWMVSAGALVLKRMGDQAARRMGILTEEGLHLGLFERVRAVFDGYWLNVKSLVWPMDLAVIYPKTAPGSFLSPSVLLGVALVLLTLALLWSVRRNRAVLFGLLWFVLGLAPSSQVVPHHIHHADRFLYLPLAGLSLAAAGGLMRLSKWRVKTPVRIALPLLLFGVLTARSVLQTRVWRDSVTLFTHSVRVQPHVADAHNNLAMSLGARGEWKEAYEHLCEALRLQPQDADVHFNLGIAQRELGNLPEAARHLSDALALNPKMYEAHHLLAKIRMEQDRLEEAAAHLNEVLRLKADNAEAHCELGSVLAARGQMPEAISHFRTALQIEPDRVQAHYYLANALFQQGQLEEAARHYTEVLRIEPNLADAHKNLEIILARQGQTEEAIRHYRQALQFAPDDADVHKELADALFAKGEVADAAVQYRAALGLRPGWPAVANNLAWILATAADSQLRNGREAVSLAEQATQTIGQHDPQAWDTLAAAYAEAGRFADAVTAAHKAILMATEVGHQPLVAELQGRLALYEAGRPYRMKPSAPPASTSAPGQD